ncbi:tetraspanin-18-like isoform X1 [Galleria mellonella]|uniref:Tetraspanin n=1 Tax=Galleria mellonella TaxID=7137 RepID=A0ABM3MDT4_GALME|nr:tetraspanin-18-like isoform X1 [Galleria mellonella]
MCLAFLVKYILFFVNFIFSLIGLAVIAIGVIILVSPEILLEFLTNENLPENLTEIHTKLFADVPTEIPTSISVTIIILGGILFLISFCGCCGAITESQCLLVSFSIVMLILAALKIILAVLLFKLFDTEFIINTVTNSFDNGSNTNFHGIELTFKCCGLNGSASYDHMPDYQEYLPPTCCDLDLENLPDINDIEDIGDIDISEYECTRDKAFDGCLDIIVEIFEKSIRITLYVFLGIIGVELISMVFSTIVCCSKSNKKKQPTYYYR